MEEKISAAEGRKQVQVFWNMATGMACTVAIAGLAVLPFGCWCLAMGCLSHVKKNRGAQGKEEPPCIREG